MVPFVCVLEGYYYTHTNMRVACVKFEEQSNEYIYIYKKHFVYMHRV